MSFGFLRAAGCSALVAVAVLSGHAAQATTLTLDLSQLSTGAFTTPLSVDGFVLTPLLGFSSTPQIVNSGGVYNLQSTSNVGSGGADTILTRADGGSFSMVSIQAAALGGDTGSFGIAVAPLSGPGAFLLGDYLTGTPAPSTFTTYDLTGYSALSDVMAINLDPVSENGDQFAIAAITVSFTDAPLPEPATIGLFGLAVTGLGFMRRRHSAVR